MSTKSSLLRKWELVWEKHRNEFTANGSRWSYDGWREPFQLLGASLIYTFNAMEVMPEGMFHEVVRPNKRDSQEIWKLLNVKNPDFRQNADEQFNELVSTMHMASSSFRLSTALCLTHKIQGPLTKLLKGKGKSEEWDRDELKKYRQRARQLRCCKDNNPLNGHKCAEKVALAMILDHRDEFGHGEQGRKKRFRSVSQLYFCRIFEAQLLLAELGVDQLAKIK
jgi:hypothetical protein